MRLLSRLSRLLSGVALLAAPVAAHALPVTAAAEVYRLALVAPNGVAAQRVDIILEQGPAGVTGFLLTDAWSTLLDGVRVEDGVLHATVLTSAGQGTLTFHPFSDHPYGTLVVGARVLDIRETGGHAAR